MSSRTRRGVVPTLMLSVLAGFLVVVPSTAIAAPGHVPCGPTYDHVLSGTPATAARTVALTFDDGPSPMWTPQVLDILRRNGVRATFFLVGSQVERYPDLARRIAAEGHTIGNHSWSHPYFEGLSRSDQAWQMDVTTEVIRRTTGVTPCVFRAPFGQASTDVTLPLARERGMSVANWSHNTADYRTPPHLSAEFQQELVGRALGPWSDHPDVLMHDGPNGNFRQNTVDSLQRIIDHYRGHGYYFTDVTGRWSGTQISDHYNRINGEWALGAPVTGEFPLPHGRGAATHYQHGSIYWGPRTGAHAVRWAIRDRWAQMGWETGLLGMPVTGEALSADGRGVYQHFERGSIYWTAQTGAWEVYGGIRHRWGQLGWEFGMGYPVTGERIAAGGGRYNVFERGVVYWSPATGSHEIRGAIRDRWSELGHEHGLGYPTTDERFTAGQKGVYQEYQRGSIYWSPTTGAHEVRGAIRNKWNISGRETGSLAYPTGNEVLLSGGRGVRQAYQKGYIYWSAASGARVVYPGAIRDRWASTGWENGPLGYPIGEEWKLPDGRGVVQSFQRGHIYWSSATGAQVVMNGPIRDRWASLGWERGVLGYPKAGVVTTAAGSWQEFTGGTIAWTGQGGAQVIRGAVRDAWVALGRQKGVLGYPLSGQNTGTASGTSWTRFTGGVLYTTPQGAIPVLGAFATTWQTEGGDAGIGRPLSPAGADPDGVTRQSFAGGMLELAPDGTARRPLAAAPAPGSGELPVPGQAPAPESTPSVAPAPGQAAPTAVGAGAEPEPTGALAGD
ncbi:MAG: polysaccharide deacetylase family protein [Actinomycetota bacterium]|nr:polysaccharide deacetylase family protein [Actinomycetota bacterium]